LNVDGSNDHVLWALVRVFPFVASYGVMISESPRHTTAFRGESVSLVHNICVDESTTTKHFLSIGSISIRSITSIHSFPVYLFLVVMDEPRRLLGIKRHVSNCVGS
jgi:hypothetical protein